MPRRGRSLTVAEVKAAPPGRQGDGNGLYLLTRATGSKFWLFRYVRAGKMREMGLGAANGPNAVSLANARLKARPLWDAFKAGGDPLAQREAAEAEAAALAQQGLVARKTFEDVADAYIAAHEAGWRNAKHRQQWTATLTAYVYPHMGKLPVASVTTAEVTAALEPIWVAKPETAARVRGRIEAVLDYATAREWRTGENPARWRGHLAKLLPKHSKVARVKHHAAIPYAELPAFMAELAKRRGVAPDILRFIIVTAARTGEVLGATWREIDMEGAVWTIPGDRMKAGREHRVPLTGAALAVLNGMALHVPAGDDPRDLYVFPGRGGRPVSGMAGEMLLRRMKRDDITVHGFRSAFRDWVAEQTAYPGDVAEAALAHAIKSSTEAAYRRGDLFEKRRLLMEEWAGFVEIAPPITR